MPEKLNFAHQSSSTSTLEDGKTSEHFQDYDVKSIYFLVQECAFYFVIMVAVALFVLLYLVVRCL